MIFRGKKAEEKKLAEIWFALSVLPGAKFNLHGN